MVTAWLGRTFWTTLLVATGSGLVLSLGAILGIGFFIASDFFALVHVTYLILTIGVPVASAIIGVSTFWQYFSQRPWVRTIAALGLLPAPIGLYATYVEPFQLQTDQVLWDAASVEERITVGVLSDLQTTEIGDYENDAIDRLIAEEPDLVLIPGDFWQLPADEKPEKEDEFRAALKKLGDSIDHVVAVNGNTDTVAELRQLTTGTSVVVLDNELHTITVGSTPVAIAGITLFGDVDERGAVINELANQPADVFTIVLSHQPDEIFALNPQAPASLMVAGHTHGGQIQIPGIGPLVTFSDVPNSVAAGGLHTLYNQPIYVSTGVGRERGNAPQVRLGVRPSIGVITVI